MIERDKIAGALYGVAIGDAMGRPTEFMKMNEIHKRYGARGRMQLPSPALFTDDTQMTLAVARAMNRVRWISKQEFVRTLSDEFITWLTKDAPRAPGGTCISAIRRIQRERGAWGGRWTNATNALSKGCGANMRVAPAAFIGDLDTAVGVSQLQAAMTHGHPTALAATELTALAMRWAAEGMPLEELPRRLLARAFQERGRYRAQWIGRLWTRWPAKDAQRAMEFGWSECIDVLLDVINALVKPVPADPCKLLGGGWIAEEALGLGVYFAVKFCKDPVLAVSAAARTSGDSDSIASIAGGIIGAAHGEAAWPRAWRQRIERRNDIEWAIDIAANWSKI